MFHRRLVLLLAVFGVIGLVLIAQLFRLAVVEGSEHRAIAESKLRTETLLPTTRGRILDRNNRVLAVDRASYDVCVQYSVITGAWAPLQAAAQARKEIGRGKWNQLGPEHREGEIAKRLPAYHAQTEYLWESICRLGGISAEELQRRLDAIKAKVQSTRAIVHDTQQRLERDKFAISEDETYDFKARPIQEEELAHVILSQVEDAVSIEFQLLETQLPGMIEVQTSSRRENPWTTQQIQLSRATLPRPIRNVNPLTIEVTGVADHILGSVRDQIWADELARRPLRDKLTNQIVDLKGYEIGDVVGSRGLERAFEDHLRGRRGQIIEQRDTGQSQRIEPEPGRDLQLTLDIALQARVQAILTPSFGLAKVQSWHNNQSLPLGTPLNAVAAIIEVATGDILAAVTMPTLAHSVAMNEAEIQKHQPMVNRVFETPYPPGSIIKPLVLAAAVSEGVHHIDTPITCNGKYFDALTQGGRCWIYREQFGMQTHGPLGAEEAMARSCNIYFYTLADELGLQRLSNWYAKFGLGSPLDVGLIERDARGKVIWMGENGGQIPTATDIENFKKAGDYKFREVIMGIGQGPVTWTVAQAANAYATLARGGEIRDATLLANDPRGSRLLRNADLRLSPRVADAALEGLRRSVAEYYGTGHHIKHDDEHVELVINAEGITVWAKTGTAQAVMSRKLDHSWFVGLAGARGGKPLYSIAVIVEYGGSGGRCAGPIANQIIHALQTEGYLPGNPEHMLDLQRHAISFSGPEDDGGDAE